MEWGKLWIFCALRSFHRNIQVAVEIHDCTHTCNSFFSAFYLDPWHFFESRDTTLRKRALWVFIRRGEVEHRMKLWTLASLLLKWRKPGHRGERAAQGLNGGSDSVPPLTATGTASPHRKGRHFPTQSCWSMRKDRSLSSSVPVSRVLKVFIVHVFHFLDWIYFKIHFGILNRTVSLISLSVCLPFICMKAIDFVQYFYPCWFPECVDQI